MLQLLLAEIRVGELDEFLLRTHDGQGSREPCSTAAEATRARLNRLRERVGRGVSWRRVLPASPRSNERIANLKFGPAASRIDSSNFPALQVVSFQVILATHTLLRSFAPPLHVSSYHTHIWTTLTAHTHVGSCFSHLSFSVASLKLLETPPGRSFPSSLFHPNRSLGFKARMGPARSPCRHDDPCQNPTGTE